MTPVLEWYLLPLALTREQWQLTLKMLMNFLPIHSLLFLYTENELQARIGCSKLVSFLAWCRISTLVRLPLWSLLSLCSSHFFQDFNCQPSNLFSLFLRIFTTILKSILLEDKIYFQLTNIQNIFLSYVFSPPLSHSGTISFGFWSFLLALFYFRKKLFLP